METIIACFLLFSAFLIVANLFDSGLNDASRAENQQLAAILAERHLERLRSWSETLNGNQYNYTSPGLAATYNGKTEAIADFPDFNAATNVVTQGLYSGCSDTELPIGKLSLYSPPIIVPRYLSAQASKIVVTVSWAGGQKSVRVVSLLSQPALTFAQAVNPLTISPAADPGPLEHKVSAGFQVSAVDSNNAPIDGLEYQWALVPISGTGTLTQARDGRTAWLTNQIYGPPFLAPDYLGTPAFTGGQCMLQVSARYHGQSVSQNTTAITLAP